MPVSGSVTLNYFTADAAASTTSYVSGAAAGSFTTSTIAVAGWAGSAAASTVSLFRDMGRTIVSSGRTFRRIQLITPDVNGYTGWTSSTSGTAGVWQASTDGVTGGPVPSSSLADANYNAFYYETGAYGLGAPCSGLVRFAA